MPEPGPDGEAGDRIDRLVEIARQVRCAGQATREQTESDSSDQPIRVLVDDASIAAADSTAKRRRLSDQAFPRFRRCRAGFVHSLLMRIRSTILRQHEQLHIAYLPEPEPAVARNPSNSFKPSTTARPNRAPHRCAQLDSPPVDEAESILTHSS